MGRFLTIAKINKLLFREITCDYHLDMDRCSSKQNDVHGTDKARVVLELKNTFRQWIMVVTMSPWTSLVHLRAFKDHRELRFPLGEIRVNHKGI